MLVQQFYALFQIHPVTQFTMLTVTSRSVKTHKKKDKKKTIAYVTSECQWSLKDNLGNLQMGISVDISIGQKNDMK